VVVGEGMAVLIELLGGIVIVGPIEGWVVMAELWRLRGKRVVGVKMRVVLV